jgi:hypothetical protein
LTGIAQTLDGLEDSIQSKFFGTLESLIFVGKDARGKTKDVLAHLIADLTIHTKDAAPYVQKILADKRNFKILKFKIHNFQIMKLFLLHFFSPKQERCQLWFS